MPERLGFNVSQHVQDGAHGGRKRHPSGIIEVEAGAVRRLIHRDPEQAPVVDHRLGHIVDGVPQADTHIRTFRCRITGDIRNVQKPALRDIASFPLLWRYSLISGKHNREQVPGKRPHGKRRGPALICPTVSADLLIGKGRTAPQGGLRYTVPPNLQAFFA